MAEKVPAWIEMLARFEAVHARLDSIERKIPVIEELAG